MPVVFFLNKLREDANAADYEQWIREVDYPTARALPPIESYVVARIGATLDGQPSPYHYIERVEITDLAEYQQALANTEGMEAFAEQWNSFVGESIAVHGEEIE